MASDNKDLGLFRLDGIPAAPRGVPQIEVTFDIDANGILNVTAKDKGTGKEQSISITGASTLPDNEVDRMVKEAEANANEDKERREKIDRKNQADSLVYQADKQLSELGDKIPEADKTKAAGFINKLVVRLVRPLVLMLEPLLVAELLAVAMMSLTQNFLSLILNNYY